MSEKLRPAGAEEFSFAGTWPVECEAIHWALPANEKNYISVFSVSPW